MHGAVEAVKTPAVRAGLFSFLAPLDPARIQQAISYRSDHAWAQMAFTEEKTVDITSDGQSPWLAPNDHYLMVSVDCVDANGDTAP